MKKRVPLRIDDQTSPRLGAATYLLVPVVLVLALPLFFLLILVLYLAALCHGACVFVYVFTHNAKPAEADLQRPHFLDRQGASNVLADESARKGCQLFPISVA